MNAASLDDGRAGQTRVATDGGKLNYEPLVAPNFLLKSVMKLLSVSTDAIAGAASLKAPPCRSSGCDRTAKRLVSGEPFILAAKLVRSRSRLLSSLANE